MTEQDHDREKSNLLHRVAELERRVDALKDFAASSVLVFAETLLLAVELINALPPAERSGPTKRVRSAGNKVADLSDLLKSLK